MHATASATDAVTCIKLSSSGATGDAPGSNTRTSCPERLQSLHHLRYSKPDRMRSSATWCSWSCLSRGVGLGELKGCLPNSAILRHSNPSCLGSFRHLSELTQCKKYSSSSFLSWTHLMILCITSYVILGLMHCRRQVKEAPLVIHTVHVFLLISYVRMSWWKYTHIEEFWETVHPF